MLPVVTGLKIPAPRMKFRTNIHNCTRPSLTDPTYTFVTSQFWGVLSFFRSFISLWDKERNKSAFCSRHQLERIFLNTCSAVFGKMCSRRCMTMSVSRPRRKLSIQQKNTVTSHIFESHHRCLWQILSDRRNIIAACISSCDEAIYFKAAEAQTLITMSTEIIFKIISAIESVSSCKHAMQQHESWPAAFQLKRISTQANMPSF